MYPIIFKLYCTVLFFAYTINYRVPQKKVGLVICNFMPLYLRFLATLRYVFVLKIKLWSCSLCLFVLIIVYNKLGLRWASMLLARIRLEF